MSSTDTATLAKAVQTSPNAVNVAQAATDASDVAQRDIVIVLPDIRSTHNTGSFFRASDGAGVRKIILSGYTAAPPHPHLVKVSLGAEESVPWEQIEDVHEAIAQLRSDGYQIVVVEQTEDSVDYRTAEYGNKVALVFGNEVDGVAKEVAANADLAVEIPMRGIKESLNVSVAGGILIYHVAG